MKVAKIVEQTKEYKRLQGLVDNIESALENLGKVDQSSEKLAYGEPTVYITGTLTINGWQADGRITLNTTLSPDVSKLIHEDLRELLRRHLWNLKVEQDALEVC